MGCLALLQESSQPRIEPASPALAGRFFTSSTTWEASDTGHKKKKKDKYPLLLSNSEGNDLSICHPSSPSAALNSILYEGPTPGEGRIVPWMATQHGLVDNLGDYQENPTAIKTNEFHRSGGRSVKN